MKITLSLDTKAVKRVRETAAECGTTVSGLVRDYLQELASEHAACGRNRRQGAALNRKILERSFRQLQFRVGKKTWEREDLYFKSR